MASIGGSDGDGGGSRYEKDLAEAKHLAEKNKNSGGSSNYGDLSTASGCNDSWLFKFIKWTFIIFVIYAVLMIVFKFGSITLNNISNTDTISDYGISLYFSNIIYADRDAEFKVNSKTLNCYLEFDDALEEAENFFKKLKSGESFIYRGYSSEGSKTIIAIELVSEKPIYCYAMLPEEWSGNSFWGNDSSKFITEVKKEKIE